MIRSRHMRMRADDERDAAVDKLRKGLFLARSLGVEIDDQCVAAFAERTGGDLVRASGERIIERIHEQPPRRIDDKDMRAGLGLDKRRAAARCAFRIIQRTNEPRLIADERQRLALIEGMIAERHAIGAAFEKILQDLLVDAIAAGGILAIDDDAVETPRLAQTRQFVLQRDAAGAADDITDEKKPHST